MARFSSYYELNPAMWATRPAVVDDEDVENLYAISTVREKLLRKERVLSVTNKVLQIVGDAKSRTVDGEFSSYYELTPAM